MISIQNLSFQYNEMKSKSLQNINLEIKKGECILLCGKSGCGKTTLISFINGLIPRYYPGIVEGKVLLEGKDILEIPMYELSKKVGSVFQNPRSQFFNADVNNEIAFGIENQGLPEFKLKERVEATISDLHICDLSGLNLHNLSGGEKQKVAFASVYAMDCDIYLLDEPSSNLDSDATKNLHDYIQILKNKNKTIIIGEHRLYYLMDLVDRIVYLDEGKIKQIYKPDELMKLAFLQRKEMGLRALSLEEVKINTSNEHFSNNNMLVIKDLNLFYKSKHILNISLTAKQGEIIGIVGANGAGKSTFSRALCGLHKHRTGDIFWHQQKLKVKQSMRLAYMVMQDVNYELFGESVYDECCLGIKNVNKEEIEETLKILNLYQYSDKHPNTLSGGQKQRVAVAVSMICKKDLLIFDEPTSGLDFDGMMQVSNLLKKLALKNKVIFVVTHDYEFLCQCCHRVICFDNHRVSHDFIVSNQTIKLLKEIFKI